VQEITGRIRSAGNFLLLVMDILWKREMPENEIEYDYLAVKFCCVPILMYGTATWTGPRQQI
jgi:hypothetical protein